MRKLAIGLMVVLMCAASANALPLLQNGDFSAGEASWSRYTSSWGGPFNFDASTGVGHEWLDAGSQAWYQTFASIPGETYTISGTWWGSNVGWGEVMMFNDSGASVTDQIDAAVAPGSIIYKRDGGDTWSPSPFATTPPHAGASDNPNVLCTGTVMYVALKVGQSGGGMSDINFDNVIVTPEPASLLLVGFGALPLLLRRRRA